MSYVPFNIEQFEHSVKVIMAKVQNIVVLLLVACILIGIMVNFRYDFNLFLRSTQLATRPNLTGIRQNKLVINSTNYITARWERRQGLGNHMFQYASLIGLAIQLNMEPIIVASEPDLLKDVFDLKIRRLNQTINWRNFGEECGSCYTPKRYLNLQRNMSWRLTGIFQSYRYFQGIHSQIISQFVFKNDIVVKATVRRAKILNEFCQNATVRNCVLIGVHIRRGDYLHPSWINIGFLVADESYIVRAVQWYQQNFAKFTRVFVVLGNDIDWNSRTFPSLINDSFVVLKPTSAAGDLCLLSLTDHTIMTVGTYGFWAAYLTGGNVTYLKKFTRERTEAAEWLKNFTFPPDWTGL